MRDSETIRFWRGSLPHWEVVDGLYFVTIHVRGAVPEEAMRRISGKLESIGNEDESDYAERYRRVFRNIESYLEDAPQVCDLDDPKAAGLIVEAIDYYVSQGKWRIIAYVIMPNHVHLFFSSDTPLKRLLEDFKRWTAKKIREAQGKSGRLWQREWFDHWSRSAEQDARIIRYIRDNPVKAGLVSDWRDWRWTRVPEAYHE
jgi:REP element-mobilizing transposase RayT